MKSDAVRHVELKVLALAHYGGVICKCGESRLVCMTLSHLAPIEQYDGSGHNFYSQLKRDGYPMLPLVSECIACNVARDSWGNSSTTEAA